MTEFSEIEEEFFVKQMESFRTKLLNSDLEGLRVGQCAADISELAMSEFKSVVLGILIHRSH